MINDKLLLEFANSFYGYGNYQAPYWFLGMEEGGGNSVDEINHRFSAWKMRGCMELEDIAEYHAAIGISQYFDKKPKIQNTWGKQIRFLLGVTRQPVSTEIVRNYQRDSWGRKNGESCVVELFPLPSPGTNVWIYEKESTLENLKNREIYRDAFLATRVGHIRNNVAAYKPKVICAFGITYLNYWAMFTNGGFSENVEGKYFYSNIGETKFLVLQHPAAVGVTGEYFYDIGKAVAID